MSEKEIAYRGRAELENIVVRLDARGWSIRKMRDALKVSRNLIRKILRKHQEAREHGHNLIVPTTRTPRATKLDSYTDKMKELLVEFPDIRGQRMFEILTEEEGYKGGITQVRERLKALRPKPKSDPVVRYETPPGDLGQFDWSPYNVPLKGGGKLKVLCFSYILAYSRRQFIDFTLHRDFHTLIRRHVDAFKHFGGVPERCLYDGEKTVILRWEGRQAIFNPAFLAFATHYNCRPVGCGPRRPETKGKIEQPFKYVDSSLLNARKFHDFDDLRAFARWWIVNRSDKHKHDTTDRQPLELFLAEEAAALQPLPRHHYDTGEVGFRIGRMDGFIEHETNKYSMEYRYIGEILTVKATETEIFIYGPELDLIAQHTRFADGARKTDELPEHRRDKKVRYGIEPVRETFCGLGPKASDFLAGLAERQPRNGGFHARRILLLREHYESEDIHKALEHAFGYQAFDCTSVERILKARFAPRTLEQTINHRANQRLRAALPSITQRPLSEYQRFLEHIDPEEANDTNSTDDDTSDA
jgi:transposase